MSSRPRVAIKTLGCKLNQYESEQIREDFERLGFAVVDFGQPAEVHVINSCTVTHRTERDLRRLARGVRRLQPQALIVVTGCSAQVSPEAVGALDAVDLVISNDQKPQLAARAAEHLAHRRALELPTPPPPDPERLVTHFRGHTRAFLKVQSGCDAACAYCIIPAARGPARSTPAATVLRQAQKLVDGGHRELVLVGTHLGRYGHDLPGAEPTLAQLCESLCEVPGLQRLRLSSIEPLEVSEELIRLVLAGGHSLDGAGRPGRGKLCRHLHIPLQSGCNATLQRMRRPYRREQYAELVQTIVAGAPLVAIGADVMTGFPGETEEEFAQTLQFIESLPLAYLHVFTYSPRPGTVAAAMPHQVNPEVRKRRTQLLRAVSEQKRAAFARGAVGETLEVVVEGRRGNLLTGLSDNYLEVVVEGPDELRGQVVAVRVRALADGLLVGDLRG